VPAADVTVVNRYELEALQHRDGVIAVTLGAEGAVLLALDEPAAFRRLWDIITETDLARVELAAATPGIDLVCERGWYSSTDFWSPTLFDEYVFPHVSQLAAAAHRYGRKFGYVMTTGVETLGPRLADAGVYTESEVGGNVATTTRAEVPLPKLGFRHAYVGE